MNRFFWIAFCAAVVLATITGVVAYNIGIEQGVAQKIVSVPAAAAPPYYWHHHPWGFGFFIPFLLVIFFFAVTRAVFGRGHYRGYGCGYRDLDEWHRRTHERAHEKAPNA